MSTCQRCGSYVPANQKLYRREVYTGTTRRVNYGKRTSYGSSSHYAMRNVCADCSSSIDRSAAKRKNKQQIMWLIIAILILLYFLIK